MESDRKVLATRPHSPSDAIVSRLRALLDLDSGKLHPDRKDLAMSAVRTLLLLCILFSTGYGGPAWVQEWPPISLGPPKQDDPAIGAISVAAKDAIRRELERMALRVEKDQRERYYAAFKRPDANGDPPIALVSFAVAKPEIWVQRRLDHDLVGTVRSGLIDIHATTDFKTGWSEFGGTEYSLEWEVHVHDGRISLTMRRSQADPSENPIKLQLARIVGLQSSDHLVAPATREEIDWLNALDVAPPRPPREIRTDRNLGREKHPPLPPSRPGAPTFK